MLEIQKVKWQRLYISQIKKFECYLRDYLIYEDTDDEEDETENRAERRKSKRKKR